MILLALLPNSSKLGKLKPREIDAQLSSNRVVLNLMIQKMLLGVWSSSNCSTAAMCQWSVMFMISSTLWLGG